MSNALAIQAVTDCFRTVIRKGIERQQDQGLPEITGLVFTADAPSLVVPQADKVQVNMYLYRLAANSVWTNQSIPTRARAGERVQPPLAINLFYLITVVASTRVFPEQHVLGRVMAAVFEHPVLEAKDYQITNDPADLGLNSLESIRASGLSDQGDRIRFTPVFPALDDLVRIFSGTDAKMRLSMAYEASPVLIESIQKVHAGPPVFFRGRGVLNGKPDGFPVFPFSEAPAFTSARFPFPPAPASIKPRILLDGGRIKDILLIDGKGLRPDGTILRFRNVASSTTHDFPLKAGQFQQGSILFKFPGSSSDWSWVAGLHTVSAIIKRPELLGERPDESGTITTNEVAFSIVPDAKMTINAPTGTTNGDLEITVEPQVAEGQVVSILIGTIEVPVGPVEADITSFDLVFVKDPSIPITPKDHVKSVAFDAREMPEGDYPVRIRVSGADSLLFDPSAKQLNGYLDDYKVHIENGELSKPTPVPIPARGAPVPP